MYSFQVLMNSRSQVGGAFDSSNLAGCVLLAALGLLLEELN
jgi:hypothetical protein